MKRFVRQVLCLSGKVVVKKGEVLRVRLNPLYPLINRIRIAFDAPLKPYGITISLDEIQVIITDMGNNRYEISSPSDLNPSSASILISKI